MLSTAQHVKALNYSVAFLFSVFFLNSDTPRAANQEDLQAADFLVVDCLLPGQVRKLGSITTYVTARRPIRTSAAECEIRGGEYVAYDRADYRTSLKVWLPQAKEGNAEAMTNVGEIYEKGLGVTPDYEAAAYWYRQAAEKEFMRAQINLGYLYEIGLGVERSPKEALLWYRAASGMTGEIDLSSAAVPAHAESGPSDELVQQLQGELSELRTESTVLRSELARARAILEQTPDAAIVVPPAPAPVVIVKIDRRSEEALLTMRATLGQREQELTELDLLLKQTRLQLADTENALARRKELGSDKDAHLSRVESSLSESELELQKRIAAASRQDQQLARAEQSANLSRAQLADRAEELQKLEVELVDRRRGSSDSAKQIESLRARVAELETGKARAEEAEKIKQLAMAQKILAGPELTLIDPVLSPTRGEESPLLRSSVASRQVVGLITAPAGLLSLTVNDVAAPPNEQGVFTQKLALSRVLNPVSIVAIDKQGKRSSLGFTFSYERDVKSSVDEARLSPVDAPIYDIDFGKYHALIIGNNDYKTMVDLRTPINDAKALSRILEQRYGIATTLLLDANRYQILSALNKLRSELTSKDNLLIYYAGHGVLDEVNMRGHWLPIDAEAENTANWISNVSITDMLNVIQAKQILVISDSCYSGSLTRSSSPKLEAGKTRKERQNWLKTMATKKARMVLTSGGLEPVLDSAGGAHSVFAKALLDVLASNSEIMEGRRLYREVAARVAYSAAQIGFDQVPEYSPIRFAGHESGEFFLVPGG